MLSQAVSSPMLYTGSTRHTQTEMTARDTSSRRSSTISQQIIPGRSATSSITTSPRRPQRPDSLYNLQNTLGSGNSLTLACLTTDRHGVFMSTRSSTHQRSKSSAATFSITFSSTPTGLLIPMHMFHVSRSLYPVSSSSISPSETQQASSKDVRRQTAPAARLFVSCRCVSLYRGLRMAKLPSDSVPRTAETYFV